MKRIDDDLNIQEDDITREPDLSKILYPDGVGMGVREGEILLSFYGSLCDLEEDSEECEEYNVAIPVGDLKATIKDLIELGIIYQEKFGVSLGFNTKKSSDSQTGGLENE